MQSVSLCECLGDVCDAVEFDTCPADEVLNALVRNVPDIHVGQLQQELE